MVGAFVGKRRLRRPIPSAFPLKCLAIPNIGPAQSATGSVPTAPRSAREAGRERGAAQEPPPSKAQAAAASARAPCYVKLPSAFTLAQYPDTALGAHAQKG
jgi:hypothetical protein